VTGFPAVIFYGVSIMNEELIMEYRKLDKELADFAWMLQVRSKENPCFLLPTVENRDIVRKKRDELQARAEALDAKDEVFAIWKEHFVDFAKAQKLNAERYFNEPSGPVGVMMGRMEELVRSDSREPKVKYAEYLALARQLPAVMEAFAERKLELGEGAFLGISYAVEAWDEIWDWCMERILPECGEVPEFAETMAVLRWQLSVWSEMAKVIQTTDKPVSEVSDGEQILKFEEEYYRTLLHDNLGVELDELLAWHEEEIQKTRAEVFAIANALDIPENRPEDMNAVNEILLKYAGPCDTPDEMFERGREYLERAQTAAREYVWMPDDEHCALVGVPESLKVSFPWGGYEGGDGRRRPIYGQFFLNHYNFKAVTDGWIKMQAIHEAYPGHHVQYVRSITDYLPETAKIGVKEVPIIEGTAHRSERVFEFVYPEDPFYPLFVAYRRHHTAVRIKADLMLRYYGNPVKDVVKLYMDELGFDYQTARGQVKAQESMEGYFTCYYYGMKKLCDWEKQYGFDEKTYTELLFSAGNVSLENFERFLKLSEEDKKRYCREFCGLYRNMDEMFGKK